MTTDGTTEVAAAAAAGAAAAVGEVSDQQAEAERVAGMEAATVAATGAAESAEVAAEVAAESTEVAAQVATEAVAEAGQAEVVATTAVAEATEARSEVAELRESMDARFGALFEVLDQRLPAQPESGNEPEVVTVGTEQPANTSAESGTDGGSESGAESRDGNAGPGERRSRHRFGSRRS